MSFPRWFRMDGDVNGSQSDPSSISILPPLPSIHLPIHSSLLSSLPLCKSCIYVRHTNTKSQMEWSGSTLWPLLREDFKWQHRSLGINGVSFKDGREDLCWWIKKTCSVLTASYFHHRIKLASSSSVWTSALHISTYRITGNWSQYQNQKSGWFSDAAVWGT